MQFLHVLRSQTAQKSVKKLTSGSVAIFFASYACLLVSKQFCTKKDGFCRLFFAELVNYTFKCST